MILLKSLSWQAEALFYCFQMMYLKFNVRLWFREKTITWFSCGCHGMIIFRLRWCNNNFSKLYDPWDVETKWRIYASINNASLSKPMRTFCHLGTKTYQNTESRPWKWIGNGRLQNGIHSNWAWVCYHNPFTVLEWLTAAGHMRRVVPEGSNKGRDK